MNWLMQNQLMCSNINEVLRIIIKLLTSKNKSNISLGKKVNQYVLKYIHFTTQKRQILNDFFFKTVTKKQVMI